MSAALAFELRIVAGHVAFQAVRLQAGLLPDAMHGVFADAAAQRPAYGNSSAWNHRWVFSEWPPECGRAERGQHTGLWPG